LLHKDLVLVQEVEAVVTSRSMSEPDLEEHVLLLGLVLLGGAALLLDAG